MVPVAHRNRDISTSLPYTYEVYWVVEDSAEDLALSDVFLTSSDGL